MDRSVLRMFTKFITFPLLLMGLRWAEVFFLNEIVDKSNFF
jgi:hypothetical protein